MVNHIYLIQMIFLCKNHYIKNMYFFIYKHYYLYLYNSNLMYTMHNINYLRIRYIKTGSKT